MVSVHRVNPVVKKRFFYALIALFALAIFGWLEFSNWLMDIRSAQSAEAKRLLTLAFRLLILIMGISLMGFALYLLNLGKRTREALRYPPPNTPIIRDTLIIEGKAALIRGRLLQAMGYAVLALAGAFVIVSCLLLLELTNSAV